MKGKENDRSYHGGCDARFSCVAVMQLYGLTKEEILEGWECLCGEKIEATEFDFYDIMIPRFTASVLPIDELAMDDYPGSITWEHTTKRTIKNVRDWRHKKCLMDIKSQTV